MFNLPRWQTIGIITVTVLAVIFALPNVLAAAVLDLLPSLLSTWVRWRRPIELPI
jgi:hypothetical protein